MPVCANQSFPSQSPFQDHKILSCGRRTTTIDHRTSKRHEFVMPAYMFITVGFIRRTKLVHCSHLIVVVTHCATAEETACIALSVCALKPQFNIMCCP